ncbi:uncharacterized protein SAPINGB_P006144 [Magnusiomyces paraingens]|uniref:Uncharacterized protein n=1 Tax=Magnusiomyces paraingens TaxID=2606893 RepID=A0A5E8C3H9_9ASCO|nr:uncharacterized protein SAPINGB_P006144 [Saprochaete ingens]VVT58314.1 unnamed protein product [Saprochaete ingens]
MDKEILLSSKNTTDKTPPEISNLLQLQISFPFEHSADETAITPSSSEGEPSQLYDILDKDSDFLEFSDIEEYIVGFDDDIANKTHEILIGNARTHFSQTDELNNLCNKGLVLHKGTNDITQYGLKAPQSKKHTHKKKKPTLKLSQKTRATKRIELDLEDVCNQVQDISVQILISGILSGSTTPG